MRNEEPMSEETPAQGRARGEFAVTYPNGMAARVANADEQQCPGTRWPYRCAYPVGHAELTVDGCQYAHHVPGLVSWNPIPVEPPDDERCASRAPSDPTAQCVRPAGHAGPHAPRAQLADGTVRWMDADTENTVRSDAAAASEWLGRADRMLRDDECAGLAMDGADGPRYCARPRGHEDMCTDERGAPLLSDAPPGGDDDSETVRKLIERAMATGRVKVFTNAGDAGTCRKAPSTAVRVRFIDLPHRHTEGRGPFGNLLHLAEPGGFALVVDRFKHLAHLEGEREFWQEFGAKIGAHVVLCYPGELDAIGWLDNVD
jgi:hypothetical protein